MSNTVNTALQAGGAAGSTATSATQAPNVATQETVTPGQEPEVVAQAPGAAAQAAGSQTRPAEQGAWKDRYAHDIVGVFGVPPLLLESGAGAWVIDADGKRYLDFFAGIAVSSLGHAHPALVAAVSEQVGKIAHISNLFASRPQLELAERLKTLSGAGESGRVFFTNSGTESNEAAFKLARLNRGASGVSDGGAARAADAGTAGATRASGVGDAVGSDGTAAAGAPRILALNRAFHGRTMGSLALTPKAYMRDPFAPMLGGVDFIDPTIEALEAAFGATAPAPTPVALFVEPVQGESGVYPLPEGFLTRARELTQAVGALLIIDEVQTGIGRTGEWFGYQHEGILPDAITLGKGLGGGVPIGALVTFGRASCLFQPGQHGTTFGGNPLATAAAVAVLSEIEGVGLVANAARRGIQLRQAIEGLASPLVASTRGKGLLVAVELTRPLAPAVVTTALERGLIINSTGPTTIRLVPPLIIGDEELREFTERFGRALADVWARSEQEKEY